MPDTTLKSGVTLLATVPHCPLRKLANRRRTAADRQTQPHLLAPIAVPGQRQGVIGHSGSKARCGLVCGQVTVERIGINRRTEQRKRQRA